MAISPDDFLDSVDVASSRYNNYQGPSISNIPSISSSVPTNKKYPTLKEDIKSFIPDLPELGMSMIPMAKRAIPYINALKAIPYVGKVVGGAALPLYTGVASAGGEAIRQLLQRGGVFEGNPPETSSEALSQIFHAGERGAGMQALAPIIGKIFRPFSGGVTPKIAEETQLMKDTIGEPPLSTMTKNKLIQASERLGEFTFPFGEKITEIRDKILQGFSDFFDRIGKTIGENLPDDMRGLRASKALSDFFDKGVEIKNKLYDLYKPFVKDLPVEATNTINALREIIDRSKGTAEQPIVNNIREWLNDFLPTVIKREQPFTTNELAKTEGPFLEKGASNVIEEVIPPVNDTVDKLIDFQKNINLRRKVPSSAEKGIYHHYGNLIDAIDEDLKNAVRPVSEEYYNALVKAKEFTSKFKKIVEDDLFIALNNTAKNEPSKLWQVAIQKDSPEFIRRVRNIFGNEQFDDIVKQWWENTFENKDFITPEGIVNPKKFYDTMKAMKSSLPVMFEHKPEVWNELQKAITIAGALQRGGDIMKGSITGPLSMVRSLVTNAFMPIMTDTFLLVTGHPPISKDILYGTLGGLAGQNLIALGASTGLGRKFLTEGFIKKGGVTEKALKAGLQIMAQPKREEE